MKNFSFCLSKFGVFIRNWSACFEKAGSLYAGSHLRLLTHVGFLKQNGLILSEVFLYMERSKNHEIKYIITVQKKFHLPKEV